MALRRSPGSTGMEEDSRQQGMPISFESSSLQEEKRRLRDENPQLRTFGENREPDKALFDQLLTTVDQNSINKSTLLYKILMLPSTYFLLGNVIMIYLIMNVFLLENQRQE